MAALCNMAGHYILALWFLLSSFFSSPNLSGLRLDVYHTSTHGVALVEFRMQVWNVLHAACWKCRTQKIAIWASSHNFVGISLQLRHVSTIGKKLIKQQYLLHMSAQYCELRPTSGWDRFVILGNPS